MNTTYQAGQQVLVNAKSAGFGTFRATVVTDHGSVVEVDGPKGRAYVLRAWL